jgi:hypothetical protein
LLRTARANGRLQDGQPDARPISRLYDLKKDPGEFTDVAAKHPEMVEKLENLMLERFRSTHADREKEPQRLRRAEAIEFYLAPRDPVAAGRGGRA